MRLLPNLRFGTEGYPEKVARRLRTLNLTAWIAAPVAGGFAIVQFLDPTPNVWKVATVNLVAMVVFAAIPRLHAVGPTAAAISFVSFSYVYLFVDLSLMGSGTGMQFYYPVGAALLVLFFGVERLALTAILGAAAVPFLVAIEVLVPHDTGMLHPMVLFGNYVVTSIVACAALMTIVIYALREAARAEATAELERARSDALLANILPVSVADRLKSDPSSAIADKYEDASILFADMEGFTTRASETPPDQLVQFLNRVFTEFDQLVERYGLEKIKTTGDAYMVVSGVPSPRPDHALAIARLALDMRDAAMAMRDPNGRSVPIRIGIGCGPVVAGVVGTRKFFYDVWGDAVNIASRMESTGFTGRIQVSPEAFTYLKRDFVLEPRGEVDLKGKGRMSTWFLIARQDPVPAAAA
jgi:adenylate cyclase